MRSRLKQVLICLWIGLPLLAFAISTVQLGTPAKYLLNQLKLSAAMYDFDSNGYADLAIVAAPGVQVFRGNSNGVFSVVKTNVVTNAVCLVIAEMDGAFNFSGLDVIAGCKTGSSNFLSLALNRGSMTFTSPINIGVTNAVLRLFSADFNADTKQDIFFYSADTNGTLMLGNGNGGFSSTIFLTNGPIAIADFNKDGKIDFATRGVVADSITVFPGNGNGTFGAAKDSFIGGYPASVAASGYFNRPQDFNGDGKVDLAIVNSTLSCLTVVLGNGDGTFGSPSNYAITAPAWAAISEFNGDTNLDLVVVSSNATGSVNILLGNGDGSFANAAEFFTGTNNGYVTSGDINLDWRSDFLTIENSLGSFSVFTNRSLPELVFKRQTTNVVLNWPRWTGFQLQSSTNPAGTWTNVTASPGLDFATQRYSLTNKMSATNQFFRLRKP